jgi:hypothetical protein
MKVGDRGVDLALVDDNPRIGCFGELVQIAADLAELGKEAGKLLSFDGRASHLPGRYGVEHELAAPAPCGETGPLGLLVDDGPFIDRKTDSQVPVAYPLFAAMTHRGVRRERGCCREGTGVFGAEGLASKVPTPGRGARGWTALAKTRGAQGFSASPEDRSALPRMACPFNYSLNYTPTRESKRKTGPSKPKSEQAIPGMLPYLPAVARMRKIDEIDVDQMFAPKHPVYPKAAAV